MINKNNHTACLGCAQIAAARLVLNELGSNLVVVNATGCLEVTTTTYPNTFWNIPWLHSVFANAAPVGSGIEAAINYLEAKQSNTIQRPTILVQAGDGATFDIGFGALTASWARGDDLLYVCYDNEGYANTGMQSSLATPKQAKTPTNVKYNQLKKTSKRDMIQIALAHQIPYIAQTNIAFPQDIKEKIRKASQIKGPRYIQILVPCLPGWKIKPHQQMTAAKLASDSGLYPLLEFINGQIQKNQLSRPIPPVIDYIKNQGRFTNILANKIAIKHLQEIADDNIKKYKL